MTAMGAVVLDWACGSALAQPQLDLDALLFGQASGLSTTFDMAPLSTSKFRLRNTPPVAGRLYGAIEIKPHDVRGTDDMGLDARILTDDSSVGSPRRGLVPFDTTNLVLTRIRPERAIDFDRLEAFSQTVFGRFEIGWAAGPSERTAVSGPIDWGIGGYGGDFPYFLRKPQDVGFNTISVLGSGNTSPRVSYISSRYAGLQGALSFQPDTRNTGFEFNYGGTAPGALGRRFNGGGSREAFTAGFQNVVEGAVNYDATFAGVRVRASSAAISGSAIRSPTGNPFYDLSSQQAGFALSWQGWTAGFGYVVAGRSGYTKFLNKRQRAYQYDLNGGLQYETGPWVFGAGYLYGDDAGDPTERSDRQLTVVSGGTRYRLSPTIDLCLEVDRIRTLSADFGDFTSYLVVGQLRYRFRPGL